MTRAFEINVPIVGGSGRFVRPKRLAESGYQFQLAGPREAFVDLFTECRKTN